MNLDPFRLHRFGAKVWSQFNEDGLTLELILRLNPPKTFLEIGAGHNGENCTHVLLEQDEWRGYWVEGDSENFHSLRQCIQTDRVCIRLERVRSDNVRTRLAPIAKDLGDVGVFSLDIDGNDYWIWKELCTEAFRPHLCIIEFNAQKPLEEPYVMPLDHNYIWDHQSHDHGASLYSMIELGKKIGYTFVGTASATPQLDSPNAFFVRDDLIGMIG